MKIGIDFGTTFSLPAGLINGTAATLLPGGSYGMHSVFYYDKSSGILIGERAENRGEKKPSNVVRNIKMFISDTETSSFILDKKTFGKKEIVSQIIREVVQIAREEIERKQLVSQEIDGAVISVPAAFNIRELDFIKDAAESTGLKVLGFIREPVAAAISYFNAPSAEDKKTHFFYVIKYTISPKCVIMNKPYRKFIIFGEFSYCNEVAKQSAIRTQFERINGENCTQVIFPVTDRRKLKGVL